ncbi:hypothetical protein E2562_006507 [Oryza meyeriana var. granulata]|uniref:Uncharacterized protein n=1 Tax=Oryza meyeriana var. granulata TaxID=110450 RepID=A0A6G1CP90_9ORYZ|nr:hypothetical protein E2562_006507 [Oryza meyeriana var. granulata]
MPCCGETAKRGGGTVALRESSGVGRAEPGRQQGGGEPARQQGGSGEGDRRRRGAGAWREATADAALQQAAQPHGRWLEFLCVAACG